MMLTVILFVVAVLLLLLLWWSMSQDRFQRIEKRLTALEKGVQTMSVALDALKADIAALQTAVTTLANKPPPVVGVAEADVQAAADALKPIVAQVQALAAQP